MKNQLFVLAGLSCLTTAIHAQDAKPLRVAQVPLRADAPLLFAPRGWKIEKRLGGDLNRDNVTDAALVLVENKPAKDSQGDPTARQRALVVLLREGKGWHRVGFSGEVLQGTRDGGAFFGAVETPVNVSIKRGVVVVQQESGSREVLDTTHRFRYDAKRQGIFLIGFDSIDRDRATGDVTTQSVNYLTGVKRTTMFKGSSSKSQTRTSRVPVRLRSLESIREANRYQG